LLLLLPLQMGLSLPLSGRTLFFGPRTGKPQATPITEKFQFVVDGFHDDTKNSRIA